MNTPFHHTNPDRLRRKFLSLQQRLQDALTEAKASATEIQGLAKEKLPPSEDSLSTICQADTLRALIDVSYGMALEIGRPIHFATNAAEGAGSNGERPGAAPRRRRRSAARIAAVPAPAPNGTGGPGVSPASASAPTR